ncbi:MAG: hypothetical protein HYT76_04460 [Deltaproteobacteria bacterium]|nr:hypothetical protein [Deltaproteobacteria bacterium]
MGTTASVSPNVCPPLCNTPTRGISMVGAVAAIGGAVVTCAAGLTCGSITSRLAREARQTRGSLRRGPLGTKAAYFAAIRQNEKGWNRVAFVGLGLIAVGALLFFRGISQDYQNLIRETGCQLPERQPL